MIDVFQKQRSRRARASGQWTEIPFSAHSYFSPTRWVTRGPIDSWLLLSAALLVLIGEVMVFNTTYFYAAEHFGDAYRFVWKHQLAIVLGTGGLIATMSVPSATYRHCAYPLLIVALVGLCLVFVPGVAPGKVRRWIDLGPLNFQPSELAKGAVVFYLAHSLARKAERVTNFLYGVLPHILVVGLIIGLILLEPDLGGAAFVSITLVALLFVAGARRRHLAALIGCGLLLLAYSVTIASYRSDRVRTFFNPTVDLQNKGYQLNQSLLAFGAGGLQGAGLGEGRQKMFYLPEAHTDFIFAVVGEETGLWGTAGVLSLFILFGVRGLRIAIHHPLLFGRLLAFGCTFLVVCQAGLNMAVVLGLLPTKGLPLPFISYGGSALIMTLGYTGVLLGLSREIRRENQTYA